MATHNRIYAIVVSPSAVIRVGIVNILLQIDSLNIEIFEDADLESTKMGAYRHTPDLLIVCPSLLGHFSPSQLRNTYGNDALKIIALQSTFAEQSLLISYDEIISIYESIDTICNKITNIAKTDTEINSKRELSSREKEIIARVIKGMTNRQIAEEFSLSTHTIIAHRRNIANKLNIHSISGLTVFAIINKLVDIGDIKETLTNSASLA